MAEIQALESNHTQSLVPLPPHNQAIGCRWIYKVQSEISGSWDCGEIQGTLSGKGVQAGVDFLDT